MIVQMSQKLYTHNHPIESTCLLSMQTCMQSNVQVTTGTFLTMKSIPLGYD